MGNESFNLPVPADRADNLLLISKLLGVGASAAGNDATLEMVLQMWSTCGHVIRISGASPPTDLLPVPVTEPLFSKFVHLMLHHHLDFVRAPLALGQMIDVVLVDLSCSLFYSATRQGVSQYISTSEVPMMRGLMPVVGELPMKPHADAFLRSLQPNDSGRGEEPPQNFIPPQPTRQQPQAAGRSHRQAAAVSPAPASFTSQHHLSQQQLVHHHQQRSHQYYLQQQHPYHYQPQQEQRSRQKEPGLQFPYQRQQHHHQSQQQSLQQQQHQLQQQQQQQQPNNKISKRFASVPLTQISPVAGALPDGDGGGKEERHQSLPPNARSPNLLQSPQPQPATAQQHPRARNTGASVPAMATPQEKQQHLLQISPVSAISTPLVSSVLAHSVASQRASAETLQTGTSAASVFTPQLQQLHHQQQQQGLPANATLQHMSAPKPSDNPAHQQPQAQRVSNVHVSPSTTHRQQQQQQLPVQGAPMNFAAATPQPQEQTVGSHAPHRQASSTPLEPSTTRPQSESQPVPDAQLIVNMNPTQQRQCSQQVGSPQVGGLERVGATPVMMRRQEVGQGSGISGSQPALVSASTSAMHPQTFLSQLYAHGLKVPPNLLQPNNVKGAAEMVSHLQVLYSRYTGQALQLPQLQQVLLRQLQSNHTTLPTLHNTSVQLSLPAQPRPQQLPKRKAKAAQKLASGKPRRQVCEVPLGTGGAWQRRPQAVKATVDLGVLGKRLIGEVLRHSPSFPRKIQRSESEPRPPPAHPVLAGMGKQMKETGLALKPAAPGDAAGAAARASGADVTPGRSKSAQVAHTTGKMALSWLCAAAIAFGSQESGLPKYEAKIGPDVVEATKYLISHAQAAKDAPDDKKSPSVATSRLSAGSRPAAAVTPMTVTPLATAVNATADESTPDKNAQATPGAVTPSRGDQPPATVSATQVVSDGVSAKGSGGAAAATSPNLSLPLKSPPKKLPSEDQPLAVDVTPAADKHTSATESELGNAPTATRTPPQEKGSLQEPASGKLMVDVKGTATKASAQPEPTSQRDATALTPKAATSVVREHSPAVDVADGQLADVSTRVEQDSQPKAKKDVVGDAAEINLTAVTLPAEVEGERQPDGVITTPSVVPLSEGTITATGGGTAGAVAVDETMEKFQAGQVERAVQGDGGGASQAASPTAMDGIESDTAAKEAPEVGKKDAVVAADGMVGQVKPGVASPAKEGGGDVKVGAAGDRSDVSPPGALQLSSTQAKGAYSGGTSSAMGWLRMAAVHRAGLEEMEEKMGVKEVAWTKALLSSRTNHSMEGGMDE